jgi:hypothetical protein
MLKLGSIEKYVLRKLIEKSVKYLANNGAAMLATCKINSMRVMSAL